MDDEALGADTGAEQEEEATEPEAEPTEEPAAAEISFAANIMPILDSRCVDCHGTDGGWDGDGYEAVMTTGDNAPVIIPGDVEGSLLAQKMLGTHEEGDPMPPLRALNDELIQIILDWITAGAPNNERRPADFKKSTRPGPATVGALLGWSDLLV
jgi:mono/diheme cytochrome c family protein